jgi:ATP-dependent Clp protease ATP-binding subunit ClpC
VFERLTVEARSAIQRGHAEGRALGAAQINTGHYLLGLMYEEVGLGARVLTRFELSAEEVRSRLVGHGPARSPSLPPPPLSDEARDALHAADEYSGGGDIGSDLLLLGLVMSSDRVAAQVVGQLGVEPTLIRDELKRLPGANA